MRWASGLLAALLVSGQAGAGPGPPEGGEPAKVAEFIATAGARTGCLRLDAPDASGAVCFDVQVTTGADPTMDRFIWRLSATAAPTEGRRLERMKVRLSGRADSLRTWQPRGRPDANGSLVTATVPGLVAPVTFQPPAGRLLTYADDDLYHASWDRTEASGPDCCDRAEIGAVTEWEVPRGTGMRGRLRLEAWVR